jgi:hypothetical protein
MAIRPIDVQIMVHRASEISKFNNADPHAAQARAGQFAQEFKKEVESQSQQVNNPNSTEKSEVDKDGRRGSAYQRQKKEEKKDGQGEPTKDKVSQDGGKPMFKDQTSRFSMKA